MKISNFHKIGLFLILVILTSFYPVKALGITEPTLERTALMRGENTRFYFQIQNLGTQTQLSCGHTISGLNPLVITFDEEKAELNAGEIKYFYGTLSVPADAPIKTYSGTFGVSCEPVGAGGGSVVKQTGTMFFPSINVVEKIELPTTVQEEEKKVTGISFSWIIIVLIIVILVVVVGYIFSKSTEKKTASVKADNNP